MNTYQKLLQAWELHNPSLSQGKYISKSDYNQINQEELNKRTGIYKIDFTKVPQPFWGNIINPSVLFLMGNPDIKDTDKIYLQELKDNIEGLPFSFLDRHTKNVFKWRHTNDGKYWISRFKDIHNDLKEYPYETFIGGFEFYGYNSTKDKQLTKKEIGNKYLVTQQASFHHIKYLLTLENPPVIVIARKEQEWLKAIPELKDHYIKLRNYQQVYFTKRTKSSGNINKEDYDRIINRIKDHYHKKSNTNIQDRYPYIDSYYKTLEEITLAYQNDMFEIEDIEIDIMDSIKNYQKSDAYKTYKIKQVAQNLYHDYVLYSAQSNGSIKLKDYYNELYEAKLNHKDFNVNIEVLEAHLHEIMSSKSFLVLEYSILDGTFLHIFNRITQEIKKTKEQLDITLNDLDNETIHYIAPELRPYFHQVTHETRYEWLILTEYNDVLEYRSFDSLETFNDVYAFNKLKTSLFMDGIAIYKVHNVEDIELLAINKDSSYLYLDIIIKEWLKSKKESNTTFFIHQENIQNEIKAILEKEQLIQLTLDDFKPFENILLMIQEVNKISDWNLPKEIQKYTQTVLVNILGPKTMDISTVADIVQAITNQFNSEINILYGAAQEERDDIQIQAFLIK
jgi:hypothetical protein